ncbi:MAG: VWA domain-containing protein [Planctomycetia bacterium]|nr:VWA domain-containing protein [Planctomycetia bacterium]
MDGLASWLINEPGAAGTRLLEYAWSLRAIPPWWVWVPAILLMAGLSFWFYRQEKLARWQRTLLVLLRLGVFSLILLLICRPTLEATLQSQQPRPVVLLLDNSLSMALIDPRSQAADKLRLALAAQLVPPDTSINPSSSMSQVPQGTPDQLSRADLVRLLLAHPQLQLVKKMEKHSPVRIMLFGQSLNGSQINVQAGGQVSIEGFTATETASTLGDALYQLLSAEIEADLPAAIVVMTDGLEQGSAIAPEQSVKRAKEFSIPIHTVGIGSTDWSHLQIKSVTVPEAMFLEDTVQAHITWRAQGLKALPMTMTISLNDIIVARKDLAGRNGEQLQETIPLVVPKNLTTDGPVDLRVQVTGPALEDSPLSTIEWNQRVRVIDRQVKVLLIDQSPRFETKFLMSTLLRDRRVEAHFHFTGNDPAGMQKTPFEAQLPASRADLFQYDLVILGDVNPEVWGIEKLTWLRDLVREGAGLVMIAGHRHSPGKYMKTALEDVLPVEVPQELEPIDFSRKTESVLPLLTSAGQRHEMMALADEQDANHKLWQELPGFYQIANVLKVRPGTVTLLEHPDKNMGERGRPVMALQRYGRGQVLYIGSDETWRWRANGGEKLFARFWGQVVYQLGLPRLLGGARRVQFSFDRLEQYVGKPGFLYARVYNQEYQPVQDARLSARIIPLDRTGKPSGEPVSNLNLEAIPGQPGDYRALLNNEKPGRFMLAMESPEPSQMPFHVDFAPHDERLPIPMNAALLKSLSEGSGGTFSREEDLHLLPERIKPLLGMYQYRRDFVLWNPLALVLIGCLLTGEWIIRKLSNLS